jgi:O-antigen ligase
VILGVIFGLLLFESMAFPDQIDLRSAIFHPSIGGQGLRLPEILISIALAARLFVGVRPKRITTTGLLWGAFSAWYVLAAFRGAQHGQPLDAVIYQAKAIIYVPGGMVLAAGIRPSRLIQPKVVGWWLAVILATVIPFAAIARGSGPFELNLPALRMPDFGEYDPDAASIVLSVGVIALIVEGCRRRRRPLVAIGALVLLLSPLTVDQSASLLQMSTVSVALGGLAIASTTWRHRVRAQVTEAGLLVGVVATALVAIYFVYSYEQRALPLAASIQETAYVSPEGNASSYARVALWGETKNLIEDEPLLGWGLGTEPTVKLRYLADPVKTTSHNLVLDVWLRAGAIGIALLAGALALSLRDAWGAWRRHPDAKVAGLALGCLLAVIGLLTKGMVESIFEKYRLAAMLGLLLGVIAAAALEAREPWRAAPDDEAQPGPLWSGSGSGDLGTIG